MVIAAAVVALLLVLSGRYGYHRDELYFLASGRHLAWGYPDQPPLVPALARLMSEIAPGSLPVLRLPAALAAGAVVLVTGRLATELGADRRARLLATASMAVSALLLGAGHLLSTTTFGLLAWAVLLLLVVRVLRTGETRWFVPMGLVAGLGLMDNDLVAFLLAALVVGIVVSGPRSVFRSGWLWLGAAIGLALWAPYLVWQARHGWPQLDVARSIAAGGSGTSEPRWLVLPSQLVLVSVFLAPVWIAGLWRLLRDPAVRWARPIGWAWVVLGIAFTALGGKPYYLGGMFPVLLAAGAAPTLAWARRGRARIRRVSLAAAVVLSLTAVPVTLPVVPASALRHTPIVDVNYDAGETVAWPTYVGEIAHAYRGVVPVVADIGRVDVVASNYGEAGAIDRYGDALGLPHAYSGHNAYWWWGSPPGPQPTAVLAVGFGRDFLARSFTEVRLVARLDNRLDLDTDEQGAPVWLCTGMRGDWPTLWPRFKSLG